MAELQNTILNGMNAEYVAHLYSEYLKNASKIDQSWVDFFEDLSDDEATLLSELAGASWTPEENRKSSRHFGAVEITTPEGVAAQKPANIDLSQDDVRLATQDSIRALMLIRAYRARGNVVADLDPLGLKEKEYHPELDPAHYGFTAEDGGRKIFINGVLGMEYATLDEIVSALQKIYCGKIGVEFLHMTDPEEKSWIQERIEKPLNRTNFSVDEKKEIYDKLTAGEAFEQFLHKKYPGTKRFGVDGGEALIPAIEEMVRTGVNMGLNEVVIGMAHRGRLNVLANVMGKAFKAIFAEFQGKSAPAEDVLGSGDVKYHLGTSNDKIYDGKEVHMSLTPNPSHLECVNPVVIGKVRAKQVRKNDREAVQVMPLLFHGDAAFAGQGITAETLMISELPGYRVGGTIHVVINNQIGFTTMPKFSRSGPFCTDVAKMLSAPIFHVNGDDVEAVAHVARIATEFRQTFKKDVVIDMFCYRRFGHNEGDEPAFTQPLMYKKIAEQKTTREQYAAQLVSEGIYSEDETNDIKEQWMMKLDEDFKATESYKPNKQDYLQGDWTGLKLAEEIENPRRGKTAIPEKQMQEIGKVLTTIPDGFDMNKKLKRVIDAKAEMFKSGKDFDWATGEALAFGTLLDDGFAVRLSGQDCGRGTFSQRHAVWYDQSNENKYYPLSNLKEDQPKFEVHDSPLSEFAVLGFEYGYSLADPNTLVMWEAQFGDFANGAQVMIDQFIASGEIKWTRMSGLTLLLPHGYEGQGPEHSSARPERFLQMAAEDNWQICNITTPANYFHALRRQMHRDFRKPLVIMTPKSLLRHKLAVSTADMFTEGSTFHRFLWDDDRDQIDAKKVKRVILCTGKVYYDLLQERRERKIKNVAIIRVEQLYPFPAKDLAEELKEFKDAEVVWCQEEPKNQGYWFFVNPLIEELLLNSKHKCKRPSYIGRPEAAAPATGLAARHQEEQAKLVDEALKVK